MNPQHSFVSCCWDFMFLYPLKEAQSTSSQPWSHWSALSWPMGGTDRQWWCHPAQGDGSKYIVLWYIRILENTYSEQKMIANTSCTMCLLLVCCISWRYKTYATTTASTTKTPAAAIKTTRTISILFRTHIHPVIRVFRSAFFFLASFGSKAGEQCTAMLLWRFSNRLNFLGSWNSQGEFKKEEIWMGLHFCT